MASFYIPFLMVCSFLLLTLVVALYFSRKATTFRAYVADYKQFARATLVATNELRQIQQAIARKKARMNKALKYAFLKEKLAKLKPSDATIECTGCYVICTTVLDYIIEGLISWYILQFAMGLWLIGYACTSKKEIPSWKVSRCWLISAIFCLPINVLWHCWYVTNLSFALTLSMAHLAVILLVLPLYLSIKLVAAILLVIIYSICCMGMPVLWSSGGFLLCLLGFSLMVFGIIIYNKRKIAAHTDDNRYPKDKIKQEAAKKQALKGTSSKYDSEPAMVHSTPKETKEVFVEKVMEEVTPFTSYLDDKPFYEEDLQHIINNFADWDILLKQQARAIEHIPLIPTEITLDALTHKLEVALGAKGGLVPKLLVEPKDDAIPKKIVCDINQMIQLLVPVVLRTVNLDGLKGEFVKVQLYTTHLKYEQGDLSKSKYAPGMDFPAIALVVSNAAMPPEALPQIKSYYEDITEGREFKWQSNQTDPERIHVEKRNIERSVRAHYGYLQFPISKKRAMLMVLPCNVAAVRDEMIAKIVPSTASMTQKEIKESMAVLTKSYKELYAVSDIRKVVADQILLLIRRCYGFMRHASGQLLYVRAVGIAQLVAEWVHYDTQPIYATLLYDLVRYTGLPFSYIKANYDLNIYCFVQNILAVNKRQDMEPCGLYMGNSLKQVMSQRQIFVLCIKLAERLYDLCHARSYTDLEVVKYMAQETLTVDIELAKKYLGIRIVSALANAAQQALKICEGK